MSQRLLMVLVLPHYVRQASCCCNVENIPTIAITIGSSDFVIACLYWPPG